MCVRWIYEGRDFGHDFLTPWALDQLRRIMDKIHEQGSIFYNRNRLAAYAIVAKIASDIRAKYPKNLMHEAYVRDVTLDALLEKKRQRGEPM